MKNIHLLPTHNPSRLCKDDYGKFYLTETMESYVRYFTNQNIYITSDEESKEGDCILNLNTNNIVVNWSGHGSMEHWVKIILTDNKDLIDDGVQTIDDEFLEWFVKNQSCEYVTTYDGLFGEDRMWKKYIIIPKEEPKQETLEDRVKRLSEGHDLQTTLIAFANMGAEWQQERMYSEEDMRSAWEDGRKFEHDINGGEGGEFTGAESFNEWFIWKFKKK